MFCPACGNEIPDDAKKCEHCGEIIEPAMASDTGGGQSQQQAPPPSDQAPAPQTPPPSGGGPFTPRDVEFKVVEWMQEAWQVVQADITNFIILQLVFIAISAVASITIIGLFALPGIYAGYNIVLLNYLRKKGTLDIGKMLQEGWPFYVNMLIFLIIGGIIGSIASICLVIPGMMIGIAFWIAAFLIVDKNAQFGDAMNAAFAVFSKYIGPLLVFALLLVVVFVVLGLIAMIPVLGIVIMIAAEIIIMPVIAVTCYKAYEKMF